MSVVPDEATIDATQDVEGRGGRDEFAEGLARKGLVLSYRNGLPVISRAGEKSVIDPAVIREEIEEEGC